MAAEFSRAVEHGLQLTKRIYYGKDAAVVSAPPRPEEMTPEADSYLPTAPMVYAEIIDPSMVDNPDIPSYQPYVHGRCEPPVMIPLHMHRVSMEVDCYLDTAFVTVSGAWRVHCVSASRSCCCRIAVPMGEQGSVLGVEVESPSKTYSTQSISLEDTADAANVASSKDGFLIRGRIYTLKIPQVDGGTMLSIKVSWSQKLLYQDGQFCLNVPFTFPSYVFPMVKNLANTEKVLVNVNSSAGTEVLFQCTSHPLKVSSSEINGGLLLQSPSLHDIDQREMFCFYLYPGKSTSNKIFKKEVVFLVDISGSMQGSPLENVKTSLLAALLKLHPADNFNVIAFNGDSLLFSPSLVPANKEMIEKVSKWINLNFIAEGGTHISAPLNQAINMFSKTGDSLPIIFLITDGAVEDEKDICDAMRGHLMKGGLNTPRICTFGVGSYCNHYFLQMLAQIGRGYYDTAFDIGSVNLRLERLISNASSVILADLRIDALKHLDSLEIYPSHIPDLLSGCPLFISGRYCGDFPKSVEVVGTLAELSNFGINVKVRNAKDIPLDRVFARRQVNALTANAWFSGSKQLEEKAMRLSLLTGVPSEYTSMILVETEKSKLSSKSKTVPMKTADVRGQNNSMFLRSLGIGFGNIESTAENRPPEHAEPKLYETPEKIFKAASHFCGRMVDCCCCMCFIQFCNRLNDQCAVAFTQLCTALACFGCIEMCCEVCSDG
ncbi:von willebrand factor a domain-containing protein ddb_g0292028 [Phtheirospermum japonicum]|uniref:von willebrand factor a domain-containing protein ddb_g0292028 n=1 Tax=Phtheirospermum japonicum TaxID=374723 RepID=A0A830BUP4_9LAMI|nr:von willebrand factor a domain-containing protein ddb_g0292028 [Phtheirospermum japonicum]